MAKGLRASSRKKNNAALRDRLFGPAADARTERLSAKLQELAAKPRPDQERKMDVEENEPKQTKQQQKPPPDSDSDSNDDEMDIDEQWGNSKPSKRRAKKKAAGRVQKRVFKKKPRNNVVFRDPAAKWRRKAKPKPV